MTVEQLIKCLQKFPADMRVIVQGYEGGYNDVQIPGLVRIVLNENKEWFYGPHVQFEPNDHAEPDETAVLLLRMPNPLSQRGADSQEAPK